MKTRILYILALAATLVACTNVHDKTVISGHLDNPYAQVRVVSAGFDTTFHCENAQFSLEVPVDLSTISTISTLSGTVGFVSDGSEIAVDFRESEPFAESKGKTANAAFVAYQKQLYKLQMDFSSEIEALAQKGLSPEEQEQKGNELYEGIVEKMVGISKKAIKANRDNATAIMAISNLAGNVDPEELLSLVDLLDPSIRDTETIVALTSSLSSAAATAEGSMFLDFVAPYDGVEKRFSDYVGNGKYVLVDFWASWCGPCKAEMPNLKAVYEKYHGDQFDMLSVAVWDDPEDSIASALELGIEWNQIINAQQVPTELYGIDAIPHIILFGPDGTILRRNLRGEEIDKVVGQYVK